MHVYSTVSCTNCYPISDMLNEKVHNALRTSAGEDDYMLARIKFLQHQVHYNHAYVPLLLATLNDNMPFSNRTSKKK